MAGELIPRGGQLTAPSEAGRAARCTMSCSCRAQGFLPCPAEDFTSPGPPPPSHPPAEPGGRCQAGECVWGWIQAPVPALRAKFLILGTEWRQDIYWWWCLVRHLTALRGKTGFHGEIHQPIADPPSAVFLAPSWTKMFCSNSQKTHEEALSHRSLVIVTPWNKEVVSLQIFNVISF